MSARDNRGRLLFADTAKLETGKYELEQLFGGKTIWSMIYIVTPDHRNLRKPVDATIRNHSILAGYSSLPHDCGLVIRMLDDSIDKVRHLTDVVAEIVRHHTISIKSQVSS